MRSNLIALSALVTMACSDGTGESVVGAELNEDPESVLHACGGTEFSGQAIYTDPVVASVFQCIINGTRGNAQTQDLYGKMLVNAISTANLDAVNILMGTNMEVNAFDLFGHQTFLGHALGSIMMLSFDLAEGFETDAGKYDNAVAIAELLVSRGARIDDDIEAYRELWFASFSRSLDVARIMIDAGMNVNIRRTLDESWNPVMVLVQLVKRACWSDDEAYRAAATEAILMLVEAGADVNTMTFGRILEPGPNNRLVVVGIFEGHTVLELALDSDCPEVVQILREAGACEELEGRRFEWGSSITGWAGILRFLQEATGLFEPRVVSDCT